MTSFTYDPAGNLLTVTDARSNTTTFTYDPMNRLKTRTTPLGKTDTRSYDFNGYLVEFTDRRGQISTFNYDSQDRLIAETYPDAAVAHTYDSAGRLIRVDDSSGGVFSFAYDLAGRLLSSATPLGTVQYVRDPAGRVTSRQVVGQVAVTYSYDPVGTLASTSTAQASATFTYDARNALRTLSRSNGVSTGYAFDLVGRVLSIAHSAGSSLLSSQTYTYDGVGNRVSHTTNIAQPIITQAAVGQYDAGNRQVGFGGTTHTFDGNGNLISATGPSGTTTYTWDSRNRLKSLSTSAGQTTTFTYDFADNLITQEDSGPALNLTQNYVLDDLTNVAYQSNSDGTRLAILSGRSIDQHVAVIQSPGVRYSLTDALGSTVATVDETGATTATFLYEPFGQTTAVSGSYPFLYTGRVSAGKGLYYYRARFYNSETGRFISEDPIGHIGGVNTYSYVLNNPVLFVDPSGLRPNLSRILRCLASCGISNIEALVELLSGSLTTGPPNNVGAITELLACLLRCFSDDESDDSSSCSLLVAVPARLGPPPEILIPGQPGLPPDILIPGSPGPPTDILIPGRPTPLPF